MEKKIESRAEIVASGLVQGVGFRYFIQRNAEALGLRGYTKNLVTGDVVAVVEGDKEKIERLYERVKEGPSRSSVKDCKVEWGEFKDEFTDFGIKH
jgi:acylphosphatase